MHRLDQGPCQLGQLGVPGAQRGAVELDPVAPVGALQAVERLMLLPAFHDGIGQQAGAGAAPRDGQLGTRGTQHLGAQRALAPFADELLLDHLDHDQRGGAALDDFALLDADHGERIEPVALDFRGQHLDADPRQMLRERFAQRLLARVRRDELRRGFGRSGRLFAEQ